MDTRHLKSTVLALALGAFTLPVYGQCPAEAGDDAAATEQIRNCLFSFQDAWRARDMDFIRGFFAHDSDMLLFFERRQLRGWDDVEALYENMFAHALPGSIKSRYSNVDVKASGDLAYANANFHLTVTNPEGEEMTDEGRVTVVFERRDDRWVVIHRHTSFQAPPGPQRRVARHEGPGPLWSATLEGAWEDDTGGFILATADYLAARDVPSLPDIARYEVKDDSIWLNPESSSTRRRIETVELTGTELSLQLPDGVWTFRRAE